MPRIPPEWIARIAVVLVAALVAALAVRGLYQATRSNDFGVFHAAACAVVTGTSPYEIVHEGGRDYIYPPTLAILAAPLGLLPHDVAAALWIAGMLGAIGVSIAALLRLVRPVDRWARWAIGAVAVLVSWRAIESEIGNGQANHLVLIALVAGVVALAARRPYGAGAAFAVATALKLSPGLFGVWLLATRRWRAFAAYVVTLAVLVLLLPAVVWGPTRTVEEYRRLQEKLSGRYDTGAEGEESAGRHVPGYSLRALVFHLTTDVRAVTHSGGRDIRINVIDGSDRLAGAIYAVAAAAVLALSAGAIRRREETPARALFDASVVALAMVLVAPMTRTAHLIVLLLPAFVVAAVWFRSRSRPALAWWVVPAILLTFTASGFLGKAASSWARALGCITFGTLALWIGALVFARTGRFDLIDRTDATVPPSA